VDKIVGVYFCGFDKRIETLIFLLYQMKRNQALLESNLLGIVWWLTKKSSSDGNH
jgi:hypothetical protein